MKSNAFKSLHKGLQNLIHEKKWKGLLEIQIKAIPVILERHDCIIEAPTAGGKTEAVLFPTLTLAAKNKKNSVQVLYLAPLRALLNNIELRAKEYAQACGLHAFKWHGDVEQKEKINELRNPSQLLITTPESLEAILLRKAGWTEFFKGLEVVIVDEAHNFAFGDRGGHILSLLERLECALKISFQRIALTATIGNPEDMLKWLAGSNKQPGKRIYLTTKKQKKRDYLVQFFDKNMDNKDRPEESAHYREFIAFYNLLPEKKSIVFAVSRTKTESIAAAIRKMNESSGTKNPIRVRTHHSSVSKYYREEAETLIKVASETGLQAIISTSTLELGIDIGELDQVIQYSGLSSPGTFLQRVGRTGRREDKKQFFRGFCTSREELVLLTAVVSLGLKGISESIRLTKRAYHLLAHQLICLSLQNNGIQIMEAWNILSKVYCFSNISLNKFKELVRSMIQKQYIRDVDGELVVGELGEKSFLGSNWRRLFAVFDSAPMYDVMEGKKQVGTLDSAFVESLSIPFLFVLGGIEWEAERVITKTRQVIVRRTKIGNAPRWTVFRGCDVPIETAKEAGRILFERDFPGFLDDEAKDGIIATRNHYFGIGWQSGKWIITTSDSGKMEIWTFSGDRINRTLALFITHEGIGKAVSNYKNVEVQSNIHDQNKLASRISNLLKNLKQIKSSQFEALEKELSQSLRPVVFSKFAKCLPDNLWSEAMAERVLDIEGLKKELKNAIFKFSDNQL
jgi:ATP-dependent Lhr-like helicase